LKLPQGSFFLVRTILEDCCAWDLYPQYRCWFDKLYLSNFLGYDCGPSGYAPKHSSSYIVRPTYNLSGMSAGASIMHIDAGDVRKVPPGYFWCELFSGNHTSVEYASDGIKQVPYVSWFGEKTGKDLIRFTRWSRSDNLIKLPEPFCSMTDVEYMNAEFIGDKLIEVHFRRTPDPDYSEFIPVWEDNEDIIYRYLQQGYTFITNEDDANGFLPVKRKGFLINDSSSIQ
jgi:hypothetical protein